MPGDPWKLWLTSAIFAATYLALALGSVPRLRIDRAGIAFVGATLMLACRLVAFDAATSAQSIDYRTLALLLGMMVVVAYLCLSGALARLVEIAAGRIRTPRALLVAVVGLSGILSAFLINDVVCLSMTPLVVHLARRLRVDPLPHLVALATAANVGSSGTITGNPQNIFIGSHSGISYARFAIKLLPVAAIGLALTLVVVAVVFRGRLAAGSRQGGELPNDHALDSPLRRPQRWLARKSMVVAFAAIVLFFAGLPMELVALGAASVLLLGRVRPAKVYGQIEWGLLVMFGGLFIVVYAFRMNVVDGLNIEGWHWLTGSPVIALSFVSVLLSNLLSNVPAVLLLDPLVEGLPADVREAAWLALAMSSTLAGNLTVLGSVANLIVVENARREGVHVGLWDYCRVGVPLTIVTLAAGIAWLVFVPY